MAMPLTLLQVRGGVRGGGECCVWGGGQLTQGAGGGGDGPDLAAGEGVAREGGDRLRSDGGFYSGFLQ